MNSQSSRNVDFKNSFKRATFVAQKQEADAQELLLGRLTLKAATDPVFMQELLSNPEKVAQREASELNFQSLPKGVAEATGEAAGKLLNSAVPGADAQRVQDLIFTTIDDIRDSFKLTLRLSTWLFIAGLVMITASFVTALSSNQFWAVGVSGGSGALSLLLSAVLNPLDRIRNAAGNLAQIQAAYLGFYKQLYILGVGVETLKRDDAVIYSEQIQKAATAMVDSIGSALEKMENQEVRVKTNVSPKSQAQRNKKNDTVHRQTKQQGNTDKPGASGE